MSRRASLSYTTFQIINERAQVNGSYNYPVQHVSAINSRLCTRSVCLLIACNVSLAPEVNIKEAAVCKDNVSERGHRGLDTNVGGGIILRLASATVVVATLIVCNVKLLLVGLLVSRYALLIIPWTCLSRRHNKPCLTPF